MAASTISIQFRDSVDFANKAAVQATISNLVKQLASAAEKIAKDPSTVYSFIRVTSDWPDDSTPEVVSAPVKKEEPKVPVEPLTPEGMYERVFEKLKRTEKSKSMLRVFITNSGNDLDLERLVNESGLGRADVNSWLAQTGKRIPAITNPARGVYKFDPDKL